MVERKKPQRKWLWSLILIPVLFIPVVLVLGKLWLGSQLNKTLSVGEFKISASNPHLGWKLNFRADSLQVISPAVNIRVTQIVGALSLWRSLFNLKPNLVLELGAISLHMFADTLSEEEKKRRLEHPFQWVFPNVRFPIAGQIDIDSLNIYQETKPISQLKNLKFLTQGHKGAAFEIEKILFYSLTDTSQLADLEFLPGNLKGSARWSGKSVRYKVQFQNAEGDYFHLEGAHQKSNLKKGHDSLDLNFESSRIYTDYFFKKEIPEISNVRLNMAVTLDTHFIFQLNSQLTTPPFFVFGAEHINLQWHAQDSLGKIVVHTKGDSGESIFLQGNYGVSPGDSLNFWGLMKSFSGTFSGYSQNLHMTLGKQKMPAVAVVRRLNIFPGFIAEADVITKDSSELYLHAYRDSSWKLAFTGLINSKERWAHGWTDTNIAFQKANVKGEIHNGAVNVEAWVFNPSAYGVIADSLYTKQTIDSKGYYLKSSRLYSKGEVWPILGKVEWGGLPNKLSRDRLVTLDFSTKNEKYGSISYAMANMDTMQVFAQAVELEKIPYSNLTRLLPFKPIVTGNFGWNIKAKTGKSTIQSHFFYAGQKLKVEATGNWDANFMHLEKALIADQESEINFACDLALHGKQFYALKGTGIADIEKVWVESKGFDAATLNHFLGKSYPILKGWLVGRLAYSAEEGFVGQYEVDSLQLKYLQKINISKLSLLGRGDELKLSMRTTAVNASRWFNDSISIRVKGILGQDPKIFLNAVSDDGLKLTFQGQGIYQNFLDGRLALSGRLILPGSAGEIKNLEMAGHLHLPFTRNILQTISLDSGQIQASYAVPGLDSQFISSSIFIKNGLVKIPNLRAKNSLGPTLTGQAMADFNNLSKPYVSASIQAENLSVRWPGVQKLVLKTSEAKLLIDTSGLRVDAKIGFADIKTAKDRISMKGELENLSVTYVLPFNTNKSALGQQQVQRLKIKSGLRNVLFQRKVGFDEIQKFFRKVKAGKRRPHAKPIDLQINLQTLGTANRIETDILRMYFGGELSLRGVYPYTLLSGEISSLSGELGQSNQFYEISNFDLKWQNATMEEGRISIEGAKRLKFDCKPETKRTCNVYVMLDGRLDEMAFTYDSDCGTNSGESIEPSALINSVSRGCFSDQYVAGAGAGNYGEAVVNFLEPALNEQLSNVGSRFSGGWIKSTQISGIGTMVSKDTIGAAPVAIGIQSKEKWRMTVKAKAGYHPEKKVANPWENKVAWEWRPPLEKMVKSSPWKKRVRDRVVLEVSGETRPEEKVIDEQAQQIRKQVGIRYHYKFWDLW